MRRLISQLGTAVGAVLAALLAVLVLLAAGETAAWALFEVSWAQGSEIEGVLLIWFALLGAAYGIHTRIHLGVEIVTRRLPPALRSALGRLAAALVAAFGGLLAVYGAKLAATVSNTLPATGMSASVQYFPAVVCGGLMALFAGEELIWELPRPHPPAAPPMTEGELLALVFGLFAALLVLRVPVAFCLGLAAFAYFFASGLPPLVAVQKIAVQMSDTTLAAIPFFILCGEIMSRGGMAGRLIDVAGVVVGTIRGGLAMVNIVASMFFGGISGSSVADTSSIGSLLIPTMVKKGYHRDFSVAVTVTSSTQGIIIPPSHNAIIYSLAAGGTVSIQALFLAGYLPGLMIGVALMTLAYVVARRRGYPSEAPVPARLAARIVFSALPALATPLIIIVPIAFGWVPAHQAAVTAVVWAALVSTFGYRSLSWRGYGPVLLRAAKTSGMVLILIACAAAFGEVMTYLHVPQQLTAWLLALSPSKVVLMLGVNLMLLALGTFMDMAPLIVITTPILLPVMTQLGVDPVHFGIILLLNLAVGLCTPPVGSTLFVGCAIGGITIEEATRALLPFYLAMVVILLLVTFVPGLSLWLPGWVAGG